MAEAESSSCSDAKQATRTWMLLRVGALRCALVLSEVSRLALATHSARTDPLRQACVASSPTLMLARGKKSNADICAVTFASHSFCQVLVLPSSIIMIPRPQHILHARKGFSISTVFLCIGLRKSTISVQNVQSVAVILSVGVASSRSASAKASCSTALTSKSCGAAFYVGDTDGSTIDSCNARSLFRAACVQSPIGACTRC